MTPMIDVVFQLIIFFIITVQMDQESMLKEIVLPRSPNAQERVQGEAKEIPIQVTKSGNIYMGSQLITINQLDAVIKAFAKQVGPQNIPILIRGDVDARHKAIRKVMDTCSKNGVYKMRFAGLKKSGAG
jgi:biopolymer transport protein ExbD